MSHLASAQIASQVHCDYDKQILVLRLSHHSLFENKYDQFHLFTEQFLHIASSISF
jgi:hypothetical protein